MRGGARHTIQRWKSSSPGPRQSRPTPIKEQMAQAAREGREGKCRPNRPGKEEGGPG